MRPLRTRRAAHYPSDLHRCRALPPAALLFGPAFLPPHFVCAALAHCLLDLFLGNAFLLLDKLYALDLRGGGALFQVGAALLSAIPLRC